MNVETLADAGYYHSLGRRDCVCELLMRIRCVGVAATIEEMIAAVPDNPHAEWLKKNMQEVIRKCAF